VVDVGAAAGKCFVEFLPVLKVIDKGLKIAFETVTGIRNLLNNLQSLDQQIEAAKKQGKTTTVGEVLARVKVINDSKSSLVGIYDAATETLGEGVNKALAISKCAEAILGSFESICNRLTETKDSPCNTTTVKLVCVGLATVRSELAKVNGLISAAQEGLARVGIELLCKQVEQLVAIIQASSQVASQKSLIAPLSIQLLDINATLADIDPLPAEFTDILSLLLQETETVQTDVQSIVDNTTGLSDLESPIKQLQSYSGQVFFELSGTPVNAFYLIDYNGFSVRGKTDSKGNFSSVLPEKTDFTVKIYDPIKNILGSYSSRTSASGVTTQIPPLTFISTKELPDTDADGLEALLQAVRFLGCGRGSAFWGCEGRSL
jgi:hypothetical protein